MQFGYFTLSDNHYENNRRTPNQLIFDITDQVRYADKIGMQSAWIGGHHFNSLGVLSCPEIVLSSIASRTRNIRLAPAVTVLPLHHPIRVAEQWATLDLLSNGRVDFVAERGCDRNLVMVSGRLVQGLLAAANKGGATAILVENAADHNRGLYASWQTASRQPGSSSAP